MSETLDTQPIPEVESQAIRPYKRERARRIRERRSGMVASPDEYEEAKKDRVRTFLQNYKNGEVELTFGDVRRIKHYLASEVTDSNKF